MSARARPRTKPGGFTLIEVLVALAIVAVSLAAGSRAADSVMANAQRLGEVTLAQWCADNRLSALKLAHQFPDVGESEQSCEQLGQRYAVLMVVQATPNPNFRRVDVNVRSAEKVPLLTFSTVLPRY
jgi:general secretion pathway protein I